MFAEFICAHPIGCLASSKTWPAMKSSIGFILGLVDFLAKIYLKKKIIIISFVKWHGLKHTNSKLNVFLLKLHIKQNLNCFKLGFKQTLFKPIEN